MNQPIECPGIVAHLVQHVAACFRCFGGGHVTDGNPISHALKDTPPSFAAGVSVQEVIEEILNELQRMHAATSVNVDEQPDPTPDAAQPAVPDPGGA